jgi:hypothetical protein
VYGVNVSESPAINSGERQFERLRDEIWWKGREWLEALDCQMMDDEDLIGELTTPKYSIQSNGRIKVEGKRELKARGVKSPNLADAWLLTFASDGAGTKRPASWDKPLEVDRRYVK